MKNALCPIERGDEEKVLGRTEGPVEPLAKKKKGKWRKKEYIRRR